MMMRLLTGTFALLMVFSLLVSPTASAASADDALLIAKCTCKDKKDKKNKGGVAQLLETHCDGDDEEHPPKGQHERHPDGDDDDEDERVSNA